MEAPTSFSSKTSHLVYPVQVLCMLPQSLLVHVYGDPVVFRRLCGVCVCVCVCLCVCPILSVSHPLLQGSLYTEEINLIEHTI